MSAKPYRAMAALCLAIALLAGTAAGLGVFGRGDGEMKSAVSIRGERFDYTVSGVYAYNAEGVVAEGVGWDAVTLFLAVPALLLTLRGLTAGSLRARLFTVGLLGYFFYQYLMYAMYWAFGPLFPLFIMLYASSAAAIVWIVSTIDVESLPEAFSERFPRRSMAVSSLLVALLLVGMWSQRIAGALSGEIDGVLLGTTTLAVQALDLGILVPIAVLTAVLLLRSRPWGYLLAAGLAVKGVTMAAAICAMLVVAALVEGSLEAGSFAIFALIAIAFGILAFKMFRSVRSGDEPTYLSEKTPYAQ